MGLKCIISDNDHGHMIQELRTWDLTQYIFMPQPNFYKKSCTFLEVLKPRLGIFRFTFEIWTIPIANMMYT